MKPHWHLPHPLRLPLATAFLSTLLAVSATLWSIDRVAAAEAMQQSSQRQRAETEHTLAQQLASADEVAAGLTIYQQLQASDTPLLSEAAKAFALDFPEDTPADPAAEASLKASAPWREHHSRLHLDLPHEGHLLQLLADWRALSPGLHQVRRCQIERRETGLQADCQLVRLEFRQGQTP